MKNNFPKIPLFLSIIFFCISLLVFLYFFREINNNNKESQLRELEWQSETQRRDEVKTLDYSVKTIENERAQIETHFAHSSDIVPFLDTIEGLAEEAGTEAKIVFVDILEDYKGLMVGMNASGTFNGLYKFLTLLENSPYELEFVSMDMEKDIIPDVDVSDKDVLVSNWDAMFKIKLLSFIQ